MFERKNIGKVALSTKVRRSLWNAVSFLLFRPFGTKVFRLWRIFLLRLFGAQVDWQADVYASAKVWAPWLLRLEKGACIGPHAIVYNQALVTLEQQACLSQYAFVNTAGHDTSAVNNAREGLLTAPVTLHAASWVGARAFINMGVEVGERAVVGACACVTKDVAPRTVVGGNPAILIRQL